MKTLSRIIIIAVFSLSVLFTQAQFISANLGDANVETGQSDYESDRQKDILLLEQKATTIEQDVFSGILWNFDNYKSEVLTIMDREISRSGYDFSDLKTQLDGVDSGSQQWRALRISILQMEGRINRQNFIRTQIAGFGIADITIENTRALSSMKSIYFQFIRNMKTNLSVFEEINAE